MKPFLSLIVCTFVFGSAGLYAADSMQQTIDALQKQVNQVDASIPKKIAEQSAATNKSIAAVQKNLKTEVASLNEKIKTVQSEAQSMVQKQANDSKADLEKVRTELMNGLNALQKVLKTSHAQLDQQIKKLAASK